LYHYNVFSTEIRLSAGSNTVITPGETEVKVSCEGGNGNKCKIQSSGYYFVIKNQDGTMITGYESLSDAVTKLAELIEKKICD
jgi:hypothetical protein